MSTEKIDTLVVGGGQAGLAMSEHLSNSGVPHLVLERQRIAEQFRSEGAGESARINGERERDLKEIRKVGDELVHGTVEGLEEKSGSEEGSA